MAYKLQTMTGRSTLKMVKLFKYPLKTQTHKFSNVLPHLSRKKISMH